MATAIFSVRKRPFSSVKVLEDKIKAYIEREIERLGLQDYVDQVLVPTERVIQIRNGKKVHKEKVFFPGLEGSMKY